MEQKGKRAISSIVATVLLMFVVIIAVLIVWIYVNQLIEIIGDDNCVKNRFSISSAYTFWDEKNRILSVQLEYDGDEERLDKLGGVGIKAKISGKSYSTVSNNYYPSEKGGMRVYYFDLSQIEGIPEYVEVFPILSNEKFCGVSSRITSIKKGSVIENVNSYLVSPLSSRQRLPEDYHPYIVNPEPGEPENGVGLESVSNLRVESKSSRWIYWKWDNPTGFGFSEAIVYINDVNVINTSNNYYNATNLEPNTDYMIKIHTKNQTYVNDNDVIDISKTDSEEITEPPNNHPEDAIKLYSCGVLNIQGAYYILENDVTSDKTCFNITANNIVLDGNGKTIIYGNSSNPEEYRGVYVVRKSNVTLINLNIRKGSLASGSVGLYRYGIEIGYTNDSAIRNANLNFNGLGLYYYRSKGASFSNISAKFNSIGVYIGASTEVTFKNSNMSGNNLANFWFSAGLSQDHYNLIDTSNTIDYDKKIYYNHSISNYEFNPYTAPNAGMIVCGLCNNITVNGLNLSAKSFSGLFIHKTNNSKVINVIANSNYFYGIEASQGYNNTFSNITANNNGECGMYIGTQSNSNFSNIVANYNRMCGLDIQSSYMNMFNITTIRNNLGLSLNGATRNNISYVNASLNSQEGIYFYSDSNYNNLSNSFINNNYYGIKIFHSKDNSLNNLNVNNNYGYGIYLEDSSNNKINRVNSCYNNQEDLSCVEFSNLNSGTNNIFGQGKVVPCSSNNWPQYPAHYSYCS